MLACKGGFFDIVESIIKSGVDVNAKDEVTNITQNKIEIKQKIKSLPGIESVSFRNSLAEVEVKYDSVKAKNPFASLKSINLSSVKVTNVEKGTNTEKPKKSEEKKTKVIIIEDDY